MGLVRLRRHGWLAAALIVAPLVAGAQSDAERDAAVRRHVRALETSTGGSVDAALARLDRDHFSAAFLARTTAAERRDLVDALREAAADADSILVEARDAGQFVMILQGPRTWQVAFTIEEAPPFRIDSLRVSPREAGPGAPAIPRLTRQTLAATFDRLEADGWSGVVHVRLDGQVALERAFGEANPALEHKMRVDTVFGTGSHPTEYTMAAIYLLVEDGRIDLDDSIARHLQDVPADKQTMTIRHLLTGASGLPDFIHTAEDWNPDLAWIDRPTAERRILTAPLRFTPGEGRAHSHAAFGLLAAIVERAAGRSYRDVLRDRIFAPAGMTRSGFYGESLGLSLSDFAVGGGPERVGLPNIPPNWGPTSWLVMGSGGMVSTLPDLLRFYAFVRDGGVLDAGHAARFRGPTTSLDGSDRGFELFHVYNPPGSEAILMVNRTGGREAFRGLIRGLEELVAGPSAAGGR